MDQNWKPWPELAEKIGKYVEVRQDLAEFDGDRRGIASALTRHTSALIGEVWSAYDESEPGAYELAEALADMVVSLARGTTDARERPAGPEWPLDAPRASVTPSADGTLPTWGMPTDLVWLNKPVTVHGEDFSYEAIALLQFPKRNGKLRYMVEDNGRLFVQRREQLAFHEGDGSQ